MRRGLASLLLVAAVVLVCIAAPVAAVAQDAQEAFTADETASDIDRIRHSLFVIAAVIGGLLVIYVWHTNPRRRMDVAIRRRAAREQDQMNFLDDTFVLPVDVGELADGGDEFGPVARGQSTDS